MAGGLAGVALVAALPPKILNITVPQVGHLPLIALRPFFIVSSTPLAISFLALHLTQYPSAIKIFPVHPLHAPDGYSHSLKKAIRQRNLEKESAKLIGNQLVAVDQTTCTGPKLPEPLAKSFIVGYTHSMIITADARRRVTLPKPAHPGDAFDLETTGPGQFLLTRLEKPARKVTLGRENGFLVATSGKRITMAETRKLMDQFP